MSKDSLAEIQRLLADCALDERRTIFDHLRASHQIHVLEKEFGAPAEVILEAIHRAPELTKRMLRGVIADAAFPAFVVPELERLGWKDITPEGNHPFDCKLSDATGPVTIQVKLQRSEKGIPLITSGTRYGLVEGMYMVEPQRTRSGKAKGKDGEVMKTRPYRYGEFDIIAVSLRPSTNDWKSFRYTVGDWLLPGDNPAEIATYQPVARHPDSDWTDDFNTVAGWFRSGAKKRIKGKS